MNKRIKQRVRQMKRPNQQRLEQLIDHFNTEFPVGSKVILRKDSGDFETEVVAEARILGGHSAVAWFEGVSGAYAVDDRVRLNPKG